MAEQDDTRKKLQPSKLTQSIKSMEWGTDERHRYNSGIENGSQIHKQQQVREREVYQSRGTNRFESYESYSYETSRNPFKKNKIGQIDKLNELKKQYEILKNIHIEDELMRSRKNSAQISRNSQSSSSASLASGPSQVSKSRTQTHKSHKKDRPRLEIHEFQRKQLELMLSNSMAKIEDLLKTEVQYKRRIHELQQNATISRVNESKVTMAQFESKERILHELISNLKQEQERLRNLNRDLAHKVGQLEGDLLFKEGEIRKIKDDRVKYEQIYLLQREKFMNNQIEVKRLQMEKDILEKQKNYQIHRLENLLAMNSGSLSSAQYNTQILKLAEEIKLKDERYSLLLKQLQSYRSSKPDNQYDFLHKISNLEEAHESSIKKEIEVLKNQFFRLREGNENQNISLLQQKIEEFEKIIQEQSYHKTRLMNEIKELSEDYELMKKQNKKLKEELESSEFEYKKVQRELGSIRKDLDVSENARVTLSVSQMDQNAMVNRIKNPERLEQNYEELKTEYTELKKILKLKQNESQGKIRELLRKIDELEFDLERLRKQNQFNLELAAAKSKADVQLMQNQENRAYKERDEWKRQFHNMKHFYEQKMAELRLQTDRISEQYTTKCQSQETTIRQLRKGVDQDLQNIKTKYETQQSVLLKRLESLTQSNERLAMQNSSLIHVEGDLHELKQHYRRMKEMNDNVDHLWSVKEQQYANVNQLLEEFAE